MVILTHNRSTLGSLSPSIRLVKLPLTLMGVIGAQEGKGDPHRVQDASLPRWASRAFH